MCYSFFELVGLFFLSFVACLGWPPEGREVLDCAQQALLCFISEVELGKAFVSAFFLVCGKHLLRTGREFF